MLRKLLKYDLLAIYRQLIIFYIIAFVCAIIGRCFYDYGDNLLLKIVHEFFAGAATGLCVGILINNATRIWEYTKRNFYGNESYLTHTLPVPASTLYLSKFCTLVIGLISSFIVIAAILFINYASSDSFSFIEQLIHDCGSTAEFIKFVALILDIFFLECIFVIQAGLNGIILGHRANSHKTLFSFAIGFAIYLGCNILTFVLAQLWGIFDPEVSRMLSENFSTNSVIRKLLIGAISIYLVYIATNYWIGVRALQRGVDVD